jgi:hypothetical protein
MGEEIYPYAELHKLLCHENQSINNSCLKDWLTENGGPSILLHIERDRNKDKVFENGLISKQIDNQRLTKKRVNLQCRYEWYKGGEQ